MGLGDEWISDVPAGTNDLMISTHPVKELSCNVLRVVLSTS